jgi:hypothetical protein
VWCGREEAEARCGGLSSQGTGVAGIRRRGREMRRQWEVAGGGASVGLVCGGGTSVDRSAVERERGCAVFCWLSHVSSISYPKADGNYPSFFRRLSKADENYSFVRRPTLADENCCSFVGF